MQRWLNELQQLDPGIFNKVVNYDHLWRYYNLGKTPRQTLREVNLDRRRCPPHVTTTKAAVEWRHRESPLTGMSISMEHSIYTCKKCSKKIALVRDHSREHATAEWEEFERDWIIEGKRRN